MTSRHYQSQLFKFVTRQTQKFADKTSTLLRHVKLAAIWGTQIVLYPIYALFQGTRYIGQQIGQRVERAVLRLKMSREEIEIDTNLSDAPIQNVLTAVKRALVSGGNLPVLKDRHPLVVIGQALFRRENEDLIVSNPYQIQAIACAINTQKLVLILEDNVIFDVLTPEQQRQIEHRIRLELARYWQWRRKLYLKSAPLSLPEDRETLLPPIRVFRQLMAWIQTSPVAIAINLFQESERVEPAELDWFTPSVPLSAWNPSGLIPKTPDRKSVNAWFAQAPNLADLEALIWAAIHYFFGNKSRLATANGALSNSEEASPWLSFNDVFGRLSNQSTSEIQILEGSAAFNGVLQPQQSPSITESLLNHIQRYLRKISGAIVPQPKAKHRSETRITKTTIRTEITRTAIDPAQPLDFGTPTEITTTQKQSAPPVNRVNHTEVETAFDWIETPATHVEYVLTWWQKILKGLDTFVLWIEQKIIAIWHWLTGRN
jgi:hypothetical protein